MSYAKASDLLELALMIAGSHRGLSYAEIDDRSEAPTPEARRRNTQRQVKALERIFGDRLRTDNDERGKYVTLRGDKLRDLADIRPQELSALDNAINLLGASNAVLDARSLADLKAKIRLLVPSKSRSRIEVDREALLQSSHVLVRPGPRQKLDPSQIEPLTEALLAIRQVEFDYARGDNGVTRRIVNPYGIIAGHRAYLVARVAGGDLDGPSLWRVDRMSNVSVMKQAADLPADFDLAAFACRAFGVYHDEQEYGEVEWRFRATVADSVLSYRFHPDQTTVVEPNGSVTVRFSASGLLEMAWALYPWGDNVEVVQPKALRRLVEGHRRADFPSVP